MPGILSTVFNLLVCAGTPLGVLVYLLVKKRPYLPPFLMGAATFLVSQLLLRLPLLNILEKQHWYTAFAAGWPIIAMLLRCFSAGLFEETGRYLVMRFLMKKHRTFADGVAFGLGHGGFEAASLIAPQVISALFTQYMLLWYMPASSLLLTGVERLLTYIVHVGLSLVVMQAVRSKKWWLLPAAILLHAWVNFSTIMTLYYTESPWLGEGMLAICAAGFLAYILLARKTWQAASPAMKDTEAPAE